MAVVVETFSHDKCHRLYSSFVSIYIPPVEFGFYIPVSVLLFRLPLQLATIFSRVCTVLRSHVSSYRDKHPSKKEFWLLVNHIMQRSTVRIDRFVYTYVQSVGIEYKKRIQRGVYITKRAEGVHITSWDDPIR